MRQIVLIPCWRRPEFLLACLTLIQRAAGWRDHYYLFVIDEDFEPAVLDVCRNFGGRSELRIREQHFYGNSYNLLQGYQESTELARIHGCELINMIETDIFIAQDYFDFHATVHRQFQSQLFVSACRNQNRYDEVVQDPAAVHPWARYQSLGVSFRPEKLAPILEHHNDAFHADRGDYILSHFPNSRIGKNFYEQDGLIDRIIERDNLFGLFPNVARAYHAGFIGYHRDGTRLADSLSVEEKANILLAMSENEMNDHCGYYRDIKQCQLKGRLPLAELTLVKSNSAADDCATTRC